ncbi:site-specific integrase [uncultured Aquabacterium sp.]|uniref:tyrosine-type recombinase/integrase n=1 Tax=uncultured Aquabacterium sp. TaxID=158753 RepID=UPI002634F488|nr:site-specific integrase [uncultured Aquabacterium sp.]
MPKKAKEMSAIEVRNLAEPGTHFVGGVAGLALRIKDTGAKSWVLRATIGSKRRDYGLGGFPDVPLASAREAAREARMKIKAGIDPVEETRKARSALKASQAVALTFRRAGEAYIKAHSEGWRNEKHADQWTNTLATYAYPKIGDLLVQDVQLPQVLAVLEPIWTTKTETASRVRGRIEAVLDWATARGHREGLNPARWRGHLDKLLPKPSKVARVEHHTALPASEMPSFMAALRGQPGAGARALEFAILTAARSGEVRGATWREIDLDAGVWLIPGERMKAGREHRVPLSPEAVALLKALPKHGETDLVFVGAKGGQLSDMTLLAVVRRMKAPCVPHGFRSTFRDWAAEHTNYPSEMAEMALAHTISDKVEAAYRRGDMFEKRRQMMADWAAFCAAGSKEKPDA